MSLLAFVVKMKSTVLVLSVFVYSLYKNVFLLYDIVLLTPFVNGNL